MGNKPIPPSHGHAPAPQQEVVSREEIAQRNVHLTDLYEHGGKKTPNPNPDEHRAIEAGRQVRREAWERHDNAPHATDGAVNVLRGAAAVASNVPIIGTIPSVAIGVVAGAVDVAGSIAHHDSRGRVGEVAGSSAVTATPIVGTAVAVGSVVTHTDILPDHAQNRLVCRTMPQSAATLGIDCSKYVTAPAADVPAGTPSAPQATPTRAGPQQTHR